MGPIIIIISIIPEDEEAELLEQGQELVTAVGRPPRRQQLGGWRRRRHRRSHRRPRLLMRAPLLPLDTPGWGRRRSVLLLRRVFPRRRPAGRRGSRRSAQGRPRRRRRQSEAVEVIIIIPGWAGTRSAALAWGRPPPTLPTRRSGELPRSGAACRGVAAVLPVVRSITTTSRAAAGRSSRAPRTRWTPSAGVVPWPPSEPSSPRAPAPVSTPRPGLLSERYELCTLSAVLSSIDSYATLSRSGCRDAAGGPRGAEGPP
mmetsp:Transcript_6232/g.26113  ORF Transcript_6232/g.26113 Transcript_6232/m.26113 type:complete len:258 (+) Transcript_6232:595-1368(+)